jgi:hypothetical protein
MDKIKLLISALGREQGSVRRMNKLTPSWQVRQQQPYAVSVLRATA